MSEPDRSLADAELHRLVDGRLDTTRLLAVEARLAGSPEEAARVAAYRAQNAGLHALFDPVLDEPIPARLLRPQPQASWGTRIAAAVVLLAIGAAGGWFARDALPTAPAVPVLVERAATAHVVYVPEMRRPVEVAAGEKANLQTWLTNRMKRPILVPDLAAAGYSFVGGRLLPGERGPASQLMYQDTAGLRVTLYMKGEPESAAPAAFRLAHAEGVGVMHWNDRGLGFALVGAVEPAALERLAHLIYGQIQR
ncbi:MAG: anti-sigma factor [Alphaproteobacteria bacterium]|nr:anti-sigma factor [Alphaproteobacteria bacterium]